MYSLQELTTMKHDIERQIRDLQRASEELLRQLEQVNNAINKLKWG